MIDNSTPKVEKLGRDGIQVMDAKDWIRIANTIDSSFVNERLFSHKEVLEITDLKKSVFNNLVQIGIITAHIEEKGRGGRSRYSYQNIIEVMLCRELRKFSIASEMISLQIRWLRKKEWLFVFSPCFFVNHRIRLKPEAMKKYGLLSEQELVDLQKHISGIENLNEIIPLIEALDECDQSAVIEFLVKSERLKTNMSFIDNILNYLAVYPAEFCEFYWLIGNHSHNNKSKNYDVDSGNFSYLFESLDILKNVKSITSGVIIGLAEIKNEIEAKIGGMIHEDSRYRSYWE